MDNQESVIPQLNSKSVLSGGTLVSLITPEYIPIVEKSIELSKIKDLVLCVNDNTKINSLHYVGKLTPAGDTKDGIILKTLGVNYFYDISDYWKNFDKLNEEYSKNKKGVADQAGDEGKIKQEDLQSKEPEKS